MSTPKARRGDRTAAERNAAMRRRGQSSRVWEPTFDSGNGGWVRPDPHEPSPYSFERTRCACCRAAHAARNDRTLAAKVLTEFATWPAAQSVIEAQQRAASATERPGLIYALRIGDYVKLGHTTRWAARRGGYPPFLEVLAGVPGTTDDEGDLLAHFVEHMAYQWEWFHPARQIIEFMERSATAGRLELPQGCSRAVPGSSHDRGRTRRRHPRSPRTKLAASAATADVSLNGPAVPHPQLF